MTVANGQPYSFSSVHTHCHSSTSHLRHVKFGSNSWRDYQRNVRSRFYFRTNFISSIAWRSQGQLVAYIFTATLCLSSLWWSLMRYKAQPNTPPRFDCLWRSSISLAWDDIHLEEKILQCHYVVPLHSIWDDCIFLLAGSGLLQYFHGGRGKWYVFHPESCFLEWPGFRGMSLYVNNTHSNWLLISAVKAPISPFTLLT